MKNAKHTDPRFKKGDIVIYKYLSHEGKMDRYFEFDCYGYHPDIQFLDTLRNDCTVRDTDSGRPYKASSHLFCVKDSLGRKILTETIDGI